MARSSRGSNVPAAADAFRVGGAIEYIRCRVRQQAIERDAMHAQAAYDELIRHVRQEALLDSCAALLAWDEETYMPPGGVEHRGRQIALLAGLGHDRATNPRLGDLLAQIEASDLVSDPLSAESVNVREIRRLYERSVRLPRSLVEELARITSMAQQEWAIARQRADFAHFRPWLERIVHLKRCEAESIGTTTVAYDALLEEYEPGARSGDLAVLFEALRRALTPLVGALGQASRRPNVAILHRAFPLDSQHRFSQLAAAAIGFDFQRGRLDTAAHPFFITLGPGDCRLCTRYQLHDFSSGFFATLHEAGHGLYEQGLHPEQRGTPMSEAVSLGVHESQARLWENIVGRSRSFWQHFFPLARHAFPAALGDVRLEDFHFAVNRVGPSFIRVEADEVTYNLHILIRFELEQALLSGDLPAADLPAAWDDSYRCHLGITPRDDAEGCLQDGHWASGLIGYFPTYTLGNLIAAQLFDRAVEELGDLSQPFSRGDFAPLLAWLRDRVHRHASRYPAPRLIEQATGAALDYHPLVRSLQRKYDDLYGR
jgi:carboxypeptidase Taq